MFSLFALNASIFSVNDLTDSIWKESSSVMATIQWFDWATFYGSSWIVTFSRLFRGTFATKIVYMAFEEMKQD